MIAGGDDALRRSSEGAEDDPAGVESEFERLVVGADDVVLGIAAGGTTPWVLGGLEHARKRGAATALVSCAPRKCPPGCEHLIVIPTGPEPLTGSTRLVAGTATKVFLNTLTTSVFTRLGKIRGNRMIDLRATNDKLHDRCLRILCELFPELDRAEADRALSAAGGRLREGSGNLRRSAMKNAVPCQARNRVNEIPKKPDQIWSLSALSARTLTALGCWLGLEHHGFAGEGVGSTTRLACGLLLHGQLHAHELDVGALLEVGDDHRLKRTKHVGDFLTAHLGCISQGVEDTGSWFESRVIQRSSWMRW